MAEPEPQARDGNGGSGMELATRAEQEQESIVIVDPKYYQKLSEPPPLFSPPPLSYAPLHLFCTPLPLFCSRAKRIPCSIVGNELGVVESTVLVAVATVPGYRVHCTGSDFGLRLSTDSSKTLILGRRRCVHPVAVHRTKL